jgi:ketosteroid isomerase-like protein
MSTPGAAPYETLARSIERELELIGEGALDELDALYAERAELVESLPAVPPAVALPALQRAALMNKRVEIEILRRREAVVVETANVERVERTARGYAPPVENRPHVQATA